MGSFDTTSSLAIILLAALIHASFQTSISVLTLMSGHALGKKAKHSRLLKLTSGFLFGVGAMSLILLSSLSYILANLFPDGTPLVLWALCCGAVVGVGVAVWMFYYQTAQGTTLWLPRGFASYLNARSKATKQSAEAFGLGLTSVASELLFIFAPMFISALVLIRLAPEWQVVGVLLYSLVSLLPLVVISALIGGGHTIARIQRWREENKRFMQFAAGSGLLVLGMYVYVERVIVVGVAAAGGQ